MINSEGTTTLVGRPLISVSATAATHATDGTPLAAAMHVWARSAQALPAREQLAATLRAMALRLDSLRAAPVLERYSGPVLFEGRAAAQLFAAVFAPALVGRRRPQGGQPDFAALMEGTGRGSMSFTDRIGSRFTLHNLVSSADHVLATHTSKCGRRCAHDLFASQRAGIPVLDGLRHA